jgi:hypothetical protein
MNGPRQKTKSQDYAFSGHCALIIVVDITFCTKGKTQVLVEGE